MVKYSGKNQNDAITGSCWHINLKWASSNLFKFFATASIGLSKKVRNTCHGKPEKYEKQYWNCHIIAPADLSFL